MKLRKITKKIIAYTCVIALTISSLVGTYAPTSAATELPDLILDGGEEGASAMIGTYTAPTTRNKPTDDYKYLGYASFLDMVPDGELVADGNQYRYLVMTVTGDITQLRFEFNRLAEDESQELQGPYWFNSEGQDCYFVAVDSEGNPIDMPLVCDNTTIVIDLLQSVHPEVDNAKYYSDGVELDYFNTGIHMHCDEMVTHGNGEGITISNAYLTATLPVIEQEEETTEAITEEVTEEQTEAPTEAVTKEPTEEQTEAPTEAVTEEPTEEQTEAPTEAVTEEPTEEQTEAPAEETTKVVSNPLGLVDPLFLDGGEEGKSTMIKKFVAPQINGTALDDYKYMGYASFLDVVPEKSIEEGNYRYLVITYTGNITKLRFQFERLTDGNQELQGPFWFDKENVLDEDGNFATSTDGYFVTADGSDIPLIGNNTTIVIDLLKSEHPDNGLDEPGVNIDYYHSGIHMHCSDMATYGNGQGFTISNAYLTTEYPETIKTQEVQTTTKVTTQKTTSASVKVGTTKVSKAKRTSKNKKAKLTLKKVKGASGYQIKYSTSKKFKKKVTKIVYSKKNTKTITKLKRTKKYYVKARAYKKVKGNKVYGHWSKVKTIKVKK